MSGVIRPEQDEVERAANERNISMRSLVDVIGAKRLIEKMQEIEPVVKLDS